jgi:hypothetical protein
MPRPPPSISFIAKALMADGVNAAMNAVQAAGGYTSPNAARRDAGGVELRRRDDSVLAAGDAGDRNICALGVAFLPHTGSKATARLVLPRRDVARTDSVRFSAPWQPNEP